MSPGATPLTSAATGPAQADSDARDIAMLQELAEITMALSRALGQQALDKAAEGDAKAAGDLGVVVTRVGRALRQTIAYRRKIEDQVREGDNEQEKAEAQQAASRAYYGRIRSAGRKTMIERAVGRVLSDLKDEERLTELNERLDDYERLTDFTDRPVSVFVANICKAMGLEFDWSQFEHDPWAMQEAETRPQGSPFAEWWASTRDDADDSPPEAHAANGTGPPLAAE
jgi:hypothetical protein